MKKIENKITMFHPYVTEKMRKAAYDTLGERFIGQGPKVDEFEDKFKEKFNVPFAISVNSGSAALETAFDLLDLKAGDRVVTTPLTCSATNLPLIRRGCELVWADIRKDTLNIDQDDVAKKVLKYGDIKAIMNVHLGGIKSDLEAGIIPIIDDACQALGFYHDKATYTCYSFQAIKTLTTCDGGMIVVKNSEDYQKAKLLRWFGINREIKRANDWRAWREREMLFDVTIAGHKRHMNDVAASMGIAGLEDFDEILNYRKQIFDIYRTIQSNGLKLIDSDTNAYWLATFLIEDRENFIKKLFDYNIETNIVQSRNDVYNIFGGERQELPNMNWAEDRYLSIPLNNIMTLEDAYYIKNVIESGW